MNNILMEIPKCKRHGEQMILRAGHKSKEQAFCGTWYDCPVCGCGCSTLLPSKELIEFLKKRKK